MNHNNINFNVSIKIIKYAFHEVAVKIPELSDKTNYLFRKYSSKYSTFKIILAVKKSSVATLNNSVTYFPKH
jgi:hypothetical protein